MTLGIFATKTDISKQNLVKGFDKGFYFHMPIEIFYDQYSRGYRLWFRPLPEMAAVYVSWI